ncbi:DoxX family membrane protein [Patescibacteria group bacterium]|nr:DoxX family membrane protein [Patescibacteria group bacterium]
MPSLAFHILRVGLAITFLWIGILVFQEPEAWGLYLQSWAVDFLPISLKQVMISVALLDILVGIFLLINIFTWVAAFFGAVHLIIVLITTGVNGVTVRDIGLLAAVIALMVFTWPIKFYFWQRNKS